MHAKQQQQQQQPVFSRSIPLKDNRLRLLLLQILITLFLLNLLSATKVHAAHAATTAQKDAISLPSAFVTRLIQPSMSRTTSSSSIMSFVSTPSPLTTSLHTPTRNTETIKRIEIIPRKRRRASSFSSSLSMSFTKTSNVDVDDETMDYKREILSTDPLVYVVHNVLSSEECRAYIDRAKAISSAEEEEETTNEEEDEKEGDDTGSFKKPQERNKRSLTRSNPPEVSLDISKLWPLPFLSMGAAIPPIIRLFQSSSSPTADQIVNTALPPICIALTLSAILALVITDITRRISNQSSRTSDAIAFNDKDDVDFIRTLVQRVCSKSISDGHPWKAFEAPVVTRYEPGAVFARHNDASPTKGSEWVDLGGQRVVTVIVYLNTCERGGGTNFDKLNDLTVQPKEGSALVFFPSDKETCVADDRTTHESLPAVEEKWIVQLFGRVGPRVPPPLGIPDSFDRV